MIILNLVKYNDFLGVVFKDSKKKIREIGILTKITGIVNELYNYNNKYYPMTYARVEAICRIKIDNLINEIKFEESELFTGKVEVLEDEISK